MNFIFVRLICLAVGYIFGMFETAYFVGKAYGVDIRKQGSGNTGTTNTLRVLGKKAGNVTITASNADGSVVKSVKVYVATPIMRGDVNGDGEVTLADVTTLANIILGRTAPNDATDVNGDTEIDFFDVAALVNIILGTNN